MFTAAREDDLRKIWFGHRLTDIDPTLEYEHVYWQSSVKELDAAFITNAAAVDTIAFAL